ncbi:hypothetical protein EU545_03685 [Candidatus Thorarchaeota archaeon]|nr:MAG: hypothetical protein EU545_03685 [Candidatus Thorarchaeota archaeon]
MSQMRPPCELVQRELLPKVRSRIAHTLSKEGLSQSDIAKHLELTQAAVHNYLQSNPDGTQEIQELSDTLAEMILDGGHAQDNLVKMLCETCMTSRIGGRICSLHRQHIDSLNSVSCSICSELLSDGDYFRARSDVLREIQNALEAVEIAPEFNRIVPQVRANLVVCDSGASSIEEVAGVPGRITVISDRARALLPPAFGTSKHTAELLLWAKSIAPAVRACFCISGEEHILRAATSLGLPVIELRESASSVEEIASAVESRLPSESSFADEWGIHVPMGVGVEPILYLFGSDALSLADTCVSLSRTVSS